MHFIYFFILPECLGLFSFIVSGTSDIPTASGKCKDYKHLYDSLKYSTLTVYPHLNANTRQTFH